MQIHVGTVLLQVVNEQLSWLLCGIGHLRPMQQSLCLKMMLGSVVQGQAPSWLPPPPPEGADAPHTFSFGFAFCISAFPLNPFAASSAIARLVCALQPAPCSQAALIHLLPPRGSILLQSCFWTWAAALTPAIRLHSPHPQRQRWHFLPSPAGSSSPLAVHHHPQPLPCARYAVPGVSAKARVPPCPSSFNLNTNKFSRPRYSSISQLSNSCSHLTTLPGCAVNVSLGWLSIRAGWFYLFFLQLALAFQAGIHLHPAVCSFLVAQASPVRSPVPNCK